MRVWSGELCCYHCSFFNTHGSETPLAAEKVTKTTPGIPQYVGDLSGGRDSVVFTVWRTRREGGGISVRDNVREREDSVV
jgi:hypothetical protein